MPAMQCAGFVDIRCSGLRSDPIPFKSGAVLPLERIAVHNRSSVVRTFLLLTLIVASSTAWAQEKAVISTKRLTMETALKMARAAIDECRNKAIQAGVTVVDRAGQPQVMLRDVLAPYLTVEVSMKKAYTAAMFTAATSALTRQASSSLAHMDNMMFGAGGLLIQAGGEIFGGIGVSGAPDGKLDEECAQAGIDAVIEDLEFN